eukprot:333249-Prymnesium_polylepis.2
MSSAIPLVAHQPLSIARCMDVGHAALSRLVRPRLASARAAPFLGSASSTRKMRFHLSCWES